MKSPYRIFTGCVLVAAFFGVAALAEYRPDKTFPVNDNNTGLFDQPSVAMNGTVAHVAYIGDTTGTGYKVYYAAINSAADFRTVQRDNTLILQIPTTIDNTDAGNDTYADARHPKIAVRSGTEVVILFQAKPASTADTAYRLYIARLTLAGNAVVQKSVKQVQGLPAGTIEDVSWALIASDSSARVVYSTRSAIVAPEPFQLTFARIGLDNATAAAPIAVTALYPASLGSRPIPNLKLDDLNREHIAWSSDDTPGSAAGPVYYAMIEETNGVDNMSLAPTEIMTRYQTGYTFPSVLVINRSSIAVIAADAAHGDLSYVQLNPDAVQRNGRPASDNNIPVNNQFWLVPPGEAILPPNFRLFRPDAFYETGSGRVYMTGYGAGGQRGATFLAFKLNTAASTADFVQTATQFALDEPPSGLDNDYTQAAFGFPGGKVIVFWSGEVGANRNLDFTTMPTLAAWVNSNESGCAMVADPARGAPGRIPGALALFLPAAVLAARRIVVRRQRLARATGPGSRGSAGGTIGR